MGGAPELLVQHGVAVLFVWAFAVQAGMPAPAVPMLLGAGVLSGSGRMDLAVAVGAAMLATMGADVLWYALGRSHGTRVLGVLCRFSLDPDSLIRHAKERFTAHRARYLVLAKFLPGVNPLAAGLAGAVPISISQFILYAAVGSLLWAGAWIILGYACSDVVSMLGARAAPLARPLAILVGASLVGYLLFKAAKRRRFMRHLAKARITPEELKRRMDAGESLVVVDLRTALELETTPYGIPGARWMSPETLGDPQHVIPTTSEVVFYCEEPREATSARVALRLNAHGYTKVHPLSGGFEGWRAAGFPVTPLRFEQALVPGPAPV
jgi:membrane protein DedA with SNARE-associated domain/rhodanese-related sulfurtransferase